MKPQRSLAMLFAFSLATSAAAMTIREKAFTCPIGGEAFRQNIPMSGTSFGMRTDFMQMGAISSPWILPQCPSNHFVMYQNEFTPDDIATHTQVINHPEFVAIAKDAPQYYYLAKQLELGKQLGMTKIDDFSIAFAYLQASWQRGVANDYREKALYYFQKALPTLDKTSEKWQNTNLLIGELYRLLGQFDKSKTYFDSLQNLPFTKNPNIRKYINFELKLIQEKSTLPELLE